MTEEEVKPEIHTEAVLKAIEKATLSKLPKSVKDHYDAESLLYSQVSQHTAERVAEGEAKGRADALLDIALSLKQSTDLSEAKIAKILSSKHPIL